jgi:hypothetical protein
MKDAQQMFADWYDGKEPESQEEIHWRKRMEEINEQLANEELIPC